MSDSILNTSDFEIPLNEFYNKLPISQLKLSEDVYDDSKKLIEEIHNISKLNIFVGQNNSGKSLILREVLKCNSFEIYLNSSVIEKINRVVEESLLKFEEHFNSYNIISYYGPSIIINQGFFKGIFVDYNRDEEQLNVYVDKIKTGLENINYAVLNSFSTDVGQRTQINRKALENLKQTVNNVKEKFSNTLKELFTPPKIYKLYCPSVRSLRNYSDNNTLKEKTKKEYSFDDKISIENGQNLYTDILSHMRGLEDRRKRKESFEQFLSQYFFEGQKVEITPVSEPAELHIKIGNETERPIYELGDGLQMIIIMTFPLFRFDSGLYVIEEPELFMHPGLQKRLIEVLLSHPVSKDFLFLLTTHSNHFLDFANNTEKVSIFSLRKFFKSTKSDSGDAKFIINNLSYGDESALKLLGIDNTSVFLANCTIWVEGITDMLYLKKYLKCYLSSQNLKSKYHKCKSYQEGVHYSFVYSGGNNIVHYDFSDKTLIDDLRNKILVKKLCGKAFVIVDADNNKNPRLKKSFFEELGGRFLELPVIEIENLMSNEVIMKTIKSFPSCEKIGVPKSKLLEEKKYSNIRLGTYIEKHLLSAENTRRKTFVTNPKDGLENKTINSKLEFCNKALNHIKFENMTKTSKEIIENILDFIITNNQ